MKRCVGVADQRPFGFKTKEGRHDYANCGQNLQDVVLPLIRTIGELRGQINGNEEARKK